MVVGGFTRSEVGVNKAGAKGVYVVHLLILGLRARETDGISFENNLSKSDTVPLVAVVGG